MYPYSGKENKELFLTYGVRIPVYIDIDKQEEVIFIKLVLNL